MKTKVEGSTCKDHGNHCPPYEQEKPEDTEKLNTLWDPWRGEDTRQTTALRRQEGTQGILVSWSTDSLAEYTVSPAHLEHSARDPMLGHKTHPNAFQRVEAIQQLLSDLYEIKLELNHSKKSWEIPKELGI